MSFSSGANYKLIGDNVKPKVDQGFEKIPLVKDLVTKIIEEDFLFWKNKNLIQPGMEKNILLRKVCQEIKINGVVFEIALEELEIEQIIISFQDGQFKRFIKVNFNV